MHEPNLFSFLVQLANQNFNEMNSETSRRGPLSSNLPANSVIKIDNAYHQKCFINCEIHNLFILQLGKQILAAGTYLQSFMISHFEQCLATFKLCKYCIKIYNFQTLLRMS